MKPIRMSQKDFNKLKPLTPVEVRLERIEKKLNEVITRLENIWLNMKWGRV